MAIALKKMRNRKEEKKKNIKIIIKIKQFFGHFANNRWNCCEFKTKKNKSLNLRSRLIKSFFGHWNTFTVDSIIHNDLYRRRSIYLICHIVIVGRWSIHLSVSLCAWLNADFQDQSDDGRNFGLNLFRKHAVWVWFKAILFDCLYWTMRNVVFFSLNLSIVHTMIEVDTEYKYSTVILMAFNAT